NKCNSLRRHHTIVLQDRDGQFAPGNAIATRSGGILARDGDGQSLCGKSLKRAQSKVIVGGDDSVNLIVLSCQDVLHSDYSIGLIPVGDVLTGNNLDNSRIHIGLEDFILACFEELSIIITWVAVEFDELYRVVH